MKRYLPFHNYNSHFYTLSFFIFWNQEKIRLSLQKGIKRYKLCFLLLVIQLFDLGANPAHACVNLSDVMPVLSRDTLAERGGLAWSIYKTENQKMTEQSPKRAKMASVLDQLKDVTVVVADTGDFEGMCNGCPSWSDQTAIIPNTSHCQTLHTVSQCIHKSTGTSTKLSRQERFYPYLTIQHHGLR